VSPIRLVLFGRQGAGKGTQCDYLVEHFGAVHVSTGDMLRDAVAAGTAFGRKAKEYMDAGNLLPDDIIGGVVEERLRRPDVIERGFILDGFPRTVVQAEALGAIDGLDIDLAVNLDVPLDVVKERMLGRGRDDDNDEAIARRLELYEAETKGAIDWFKDTGHLIGVDGQGSPDEVAGRLIAAIEAATQA
jgi:adenylate kinase